MQNQSSSIWVKLFIVVALLGALGGGAFVYFSSNPLADLAKEQLEMLRDGDITKAYYLYTSSEYQQKTPLESYKKWVLAHPIFLKGTEEQFYGESIQGTHAALGGRLLSIQGEWIPVFYQFVKEHDSWKIDSQTFIQEQKSVEPLALNDQNTPAKDPVRDALITTVKDQLQALKKQEFAEAYYDYFSKAFRQTTPYEHFQEFMKRYPELGLQENVLFGTSSVEDNHHAHLEATLVTQKGAYPIRYTLTKEGNEWRIWAMEMKPKAEVNNSAKKDDQEEIKEAVRSYIEDLKAGHVEEAYNQYVSPEFKEATNLDSFKKFVSTYPEIGDYTKIELGDTVADKNLFLQKVTLTNAKGDSDLNVWLVKSETGWKVWGINVVTSSTYPPLSIEEKVSFAKIIEEQLKAMQGGDLSKAYYGFTSEDFEKNTSFDDFTKFLSNYSILTKFKEYKIGDGTTDGETKVVRVSLIGEPENADVDYRFVKEGNKWKIWGMQILAEPLPQNPPNPKAVEEVITQFVQTVRNGDLKTAYNSLTSPQFKEAATQNQFNVYVQGRPELNHNATVIVDRVEFQPEGATAIVKLAADTTQSNWYDFRLKKSIEGEWQVQGIQLSKQAPEHLQSFHFTKTLIGTDVNLQGVVTKPTTTVTDRHSEITVNLYVDGANKGEKLTVVLEHVDSKSTIPAITTEIERNGDSVVNVVFSPPTQGWPVGSYTIHAEAEGVTQDFPFTVQ